MSKKDSPPAITQRGSLGALYELLDGAFVGLRSKRGFLDIKKLAEKLDITPPALYSWFQKDKIPAKKVSKLIEISNGRLDQKTLIQYVID